MQLAPGARIGAYEILALLGAGGMGEVYRARDRKLDREVAVKVLPAGMAGDADRRSRFEREAKIVAGLSHPNILAIFDFGFEEGVGFAAMELLDGETLRDRLHAGPLPVRKAVDIAIQIARGLAAAHGRQVVHRDLKPENVFLLADGQVKILDFGLAKNLESASHAAADGAGGMDAPTTAVPAATDPGAVMGTAGYMAPEQVRGQPADARADLFALGAVVYEMLSGRRAFSRDTTAETMTAILREDPLELAAQRPDLPPALGRIVGHCLEKNPLERFQSASDVAFALEALSTSSPGSAPGNLRAPAAARSLARGWIGTIALAAGAVVLALVIERTLAPPNAGPSQFSRLTFSRQAVMAARFMPDGQTIVYSAAPTGNSPQLHEVRPGVLAARAFGPPRTHLLSVSKHGQLAVLIGARFIQHRLFTGTLATMTVDGGPQPLMTGVREADWGPDGASIAIVRAAGSTDRLEYPVGRVLCESSGYISDPRVSPDGTRIAFVEHQLRFDDRGWVKVVDAAGTVRTLDGEFWGVQGLAWSPDGSTVIFASDERVTESQSAASESSYKLRAAPLSRAGASTVVNPSPGDFTMHDVAADGRWLVTLEDNQWGVGARLAGDLADRDLSWLNWSWNARLVGGDRKGLVFTDASIGANYRIVRRGFDGTPPVQLGIGQNRGPSPDNTWVLGQVLTPPELVLYPLGIGSPVHLKPGALARPRDALWFPDGKSVLVIGNEQDRPQRAYRQTIPDGLPVPLLPEGVVPSAVALDGTAVLAQDPGGSWGWYPVVGGPPTPVPTLTAEDRGVVVGWAPDRRSPLLQNDNEIPVRIERLDRLTGQRTLFKSVIIGDSQGLLAIQIDSLSPGGDEYAFAFRRRLSTLYVRSESRPASLRLN